MEHQSSLEEPTSCAGFVERAVESSHPTNTDADELNTAREAVTEACASHAKARKDTTLWMTLPLAAVGLIAVLVSLMWQGEDGGFRVSFLMLVAILSGFAAIALPLAIMLRAAYKGSRAKDAINTVAHAEQVQDVGLLIDALRIESPSVRQTAGSALTTLLPRMTEADANLLSLDQRRYLIGLLHMNPEMYLYKDVMAVFGSASLNKPANKRAIDLRVAILKAYKEIGGALELPIVRRLAELPHATTPARKMLMEAAQEALPFVEARVERLAKGDTLLRPSEGEETSLLRAAHSTDNTPADQLLRSSSPTDS
jgi:hypothetical protein